MEVKSNIIKDGNYYRELASKARKDFGLTNKYSFGDKGLDDYCGGGYGKDGAFEIVLIGAATGLGKSTFILNMLPNLIEKNIKFCLLSLEDDGGSTLVRLENIIKDQEKIDYMYETINKNWFLRTEEDVKDEYTIDEALNYINRIYDFGVEIVFLDHIQFFVESIDRKNLMRMDDNNLARYIHRKLNHTVKLKNKTLVLVSHIHKGEESSNLNDMFLGSSALAQAATKILYLRREKDMDDILSLQMTKTRYTKYQNERIYLKREGMRLSTTNFLKDNLDI